jgi:hypothetical protein
MSTGFAIFQDKKGEAKHLSLLLPDPYIILPFLSSDLRRKVANTYPRQPQGFSPQHSSPRLEDFYTIERQSKKQNKKLVLLEDTRW